MVFFKTIWMWIKRILFIVCMAVTALFATSVFTDDEAVRNALSIIMAIVVMLLSVGNCILYFKFAEYKQWTTILGLSAQLALVLLLSFNYNSTGTLFGVFTSVLALLIQLGNSGITKLSEFLSGEKFRS